MWKGRRHWVIHSQRLLLNNAEYKRGQRWYKDFHGSGGYVPRGAGKGAAVIPREKLVLSIFMARSAAKRYNEWEGGRKK